MACVSRRPMCGTVRCFSAAGNEEAVAERYWEGEETTHGMTAPTGVIARPGKRDCGVEKGGCGDSL